MTNFSLEVSETSEAMTENMLELNAEQIDMAAGGGLFTILKAIAETVKDVAVAILK
jgi:hypothetical protein